MYNKKYFRSWYLKNKTRLLLKAREQRRAIRIWLAEYKSKLKCKECGYNKHPAALDFHHKKPHEKSRNVSVMVHEGYGKEAILKEIAKCICLCANCHRLKTFV